MPRSKTKSAWKTAAGGAEYTVVPHAYLEKLKGGARRQEVEGVPRVAWVPAAAAQAGHHRNPPWGGQGGRAGGGGRRREGDRQRLARKKYLVPTVIVVVYPLDKEAANVANFGMVPLVLAAGSGFVEMVRMLLDKGADVQGTAESN